MPRPAKMSHILKFFLDKKKNGINMSGKLILSEIKQNTNLDLASSAKDKIDGYYDELIAVNSEYDMALFIRKTPLNMTAIIVDLTSKITLEIPATIVSTKELAKEFFGVDYDEDLTKKEK